MLFDSSLSMFFHYYLNMFALALLSFLICTVTCDKEPILSLSLTLNSNRDIQTNFAIGNSRVRVSIDINYASVDVCCKNSNTLAKKIFYFMVNPFKQTEDYRCKNTLRDSKENDTAIFEKIGPLNVQFNQVIYPECSIGKLGFGKKSQFLALLPASERFYVIEHENEPETKGYHWKLVVGGRPLSQFIFFPTLQGGDWMIQVQTISFNDYPFSIRYLIKASQTLKLISDQYHLAIPSNIYSFVQRELISNFQCVNKNNQIYCPCTGGISSSFPKFKASVNSQFLFNILEASYLIQEDEICSTILKESEHQNWEINILLFDNVDILFDYDQKRIGLANHRKSIQKNQLINQPLQIILNCAVILLMCLFIAMVLIELIKYLTDIEDASNESFETYMLKRAE